MPYVLSRLAAGVDYELYDLKTPNGIPRLLETVTVKGGADVADKKTLVTPRGVATEITKKQAELLKKNPVFEIHLDKGVVEILDKLPDLEKEAANLDPDPSAPVTPGDYKDAGKEAPKTGAAES